MAEEEKSSGHETSGEQLDSLLEGAFAADIIAGVLLVVTSLVVAGYTARHAPLVCFGVMWTGGASEPPHGGVVSRGPENPLVQRRQALDLILVEM